MLISDAVFINKFFPVMFFKYGMILSLTKSNTRKIVKFFFSVAKDVILGSEKNCVSYWDQRKKLTEV